MEYTSALTFNRALNSCAMAGVMINRVREVFTGKTKVEKLQGISDDELYGVTNSEDVLKDINVLSSKKAKRSKNYEMNDTCKGNMALLSVGTEAWERTLTSGKRKEKERSEIAASCTVTSKGKIYQKWNAKTGKEIKSETAQSCSSEIFDECPPLFVNELTPPTPITFDTHQSYGQPRDLALVLEHSSRGDVLTNHVTLNVTAANAWEKPKNHTTIKSTVINFFSRFKREKKTKVMKICT